MTEIPRIGEILVGTGLVDPGSAGGGYGYGDAAAAANATNATQAASFDVEAVASYARASATWLL
jgi:hypothetical protein